MIASSEQEKFTTIPKLDGLLSDEKLDYVHITTNNTIEGTKYVDIPHIERVPLVADMSSNILSEQYDVSKFGLIYAGAQKFRTSGLNDCYYKKRFNWGADGSCPTMLNYETYSKNNSLYNTPPSFSIYVTKLILEWLKEQGGVSAIEEQNRMKSSLIYHF